MALHAPICTGGAWPGASPPAAACRKGMLSSLLKASDSLQSINQSVNQSVHQSIIHSLIHLLTHSLTHSLNHSFTHSLTHSLTHSFIHSFIHSFNPFIRCSSHPSINKYGDTLGWEPHTKVWQSTWVECSFCAGEPHSGTDNKGCT